MIVPSLDFAELQQFFSRYFHLSKNVDPNVFLVLHLPTYWGLLYSILLKYVQMSNSSQKKKPVIGITIGDINGVGPEVIIKSLEDSQNTQTIYSGYLRFIKSHIISIRKAVEIKKISITNKSRALEKIYHNKVNILNMSGKKWSKSNPAKPMKPEGNMLEFPWKRPLEDLKEGKIQAITTAPLK